MKNKIRESIGERSTKSTLKIESAGQDSVIPQLQPQVTCEMRAQTTPGKKFKLVNALIVHECKWIERGRRREELSLAVLAYSSTN